jgi:hypothetical protein
VCCTRPQVQQVEGDTDLRTRVKLVTCAACSTPAGTPTLHNTQRWHPRMPTRGRWRGAQATVCPDALQ